MVNRLAQETSPYLRQHADNPVQWYPWGEEALRLARADNKPILLSIGYSACHWCHVMAHESFEDPEIAAAMNRNFVNIKVDREERPDLDQIYQTAHHMITQRSGGWPLTMFLTPDQKPFFGGTYFPKQPRYGLPGFADILERVAAAYREQADKIAEQNEQLAELLSRTVPMSVAADINLSGEPLAAAVTELKRMFDPVHGGLGGAPKFPHPAELELCLARGVVTDDERARQVTLHTLRKMAEGGIYDQLGGGFCRYSVDEQWAIPHFEKMLYDNGPLLRLYVHAWLATGEPLFRRVCEETAQWVMREMQSPEGGYYSSLDADSEHEEGKFYVWSQEEVARLLSDEEYAVAGACYGLDRPPNFEGRHWHLRIAKPLERVADALGISTALARDRLDSARAKLWQARERRIRPGRDEKILTSWNGLMIQGMAYAGRALGREDWLASARKATHFLRATLWRDGRLLATYKDGKAHLNAYLDDHAFLLAALLELMQSGFSREDMEFAQDLAEAMLTRFEDERSGAFFFTSRDHEPLILRPKPGFDNATPSGNGTAALALQRFGHLIGEPRYLRSAERTLRLFFPQLQQHASGFSTLCLALAEAITPPTIVLLRGLDADIVSWSRQLAQRYRPATLMLCIPDGAAGLPAAMDKPQRRGVNAWVCRGVECLPPIDQWAELERALAA
ncbi:MAG TPA: thioredoxin domain-containing protein [Burkholderiales bacterium]|nr:thioredoxin domain-containing protein [Burkholderiales bacterium]